LKSLMLLWQMTANEVGGWCQTSTDRDFKTVTDRVAHEGLSFLTIALPQFCKDLQKGLEQGYVDSSLFAGFKRKAGLPIFLSGFLSRVFSSDGVLLPDPHVDSIQAIRQLTLLFSKIELPCAPARIRNAFQEFMQCEQDVRVHDRLMTDEVRSDFRRISALLYADLFSSIDKAVYDGDLVPRHGPGATADRLKGNRKYNQVDWPRRLENLFPAVEFLFPSYSFWRDAQRVNILEPGAEMPVRVITVPKTLKTPRIIAIEPTAMQYMQQALLEKIVGGVREDFLLYRFVGFDDQISNQVMAQRGSLHGDLATLDLSQASDRVSNQHVRDLLRNHPWLFQAVDATRSRKADVPGFGVQRLAKFASMGSALCFPFEAFVFLTVCFMGIEKSLGRHLTARDLLDHVGRVRIFGDDIIIPKDTVSSVVATLEFFGFKVGRDKSFWNGKFRESCGKEYYNGLDVSVVKVRRVLPSRRSHVEELVSLTALRNNMFSHGLWKTARYLDDILDKFLDLPRVHPTSPSLGKHTFLDYQVDRNCEFTHAPLVRGYVVKSRFPDSKLSGAGALLKFFLKRGDEPHQEGHLERAGRPTSVDIKRRWVRPF